MREKTLHGWGKPDQEPTGRSALRHAKIEVRDILRGSHEAYRLINAFPTHSELTEEQKAEIIKSLPVIGSKDAVLGRLAIFVSGGMKSLDLARTEGGWRAFRKVDKNVEGALGELYESRVRQREIGVAMPKDAIDKFSPGAMAESHATSFGGIENEAGFYLLTRRRLVAQFAIWKTGEPIEIHARSDYLLNANVAPEELAERARAIATGDYGSALAMRPVEFSEFHRTLRRSFNLVADNAVQLEHPSLSAEAKNYYVIRHDKEPNEPDED